MSINNMENQGADLLSLPGSERPPWFAALGVVLLGLVVLVIIGVGSRSTSNSTSDGSVRTVVIDGSGHGDR